ncbi:hypothetical protein KK083_30200 [Fulvivirgaceae bacterium PWU4]|uniref:Uncharacterized protein n=1 Tax=Chryseosolibacter histidini TaxID=2782349 RepID=A0AAP2DUH2_9BACT|nr:hypothetical protein [Chryseosolibacter histidini]MBT1701202.1 hypothetical protein [Chryseosolibacter histidini]
MAQRIIDRSYVGEVLQHVYDSDLDISITLISRGGYFYIASEDKRFSLQGTTIEEAVTHFAFELAKEFPSSKFATWWVNNFREEEYNRPGHRDKHY